MRILLFSLMPNNNKKPNLGKPIPSKMDAVRKAAKSVNNLSSKNVNSNNLNKIFKFVSAMSDSNKAFKFGHLITEILTTGNSLFNTRAQNDLLSFSNQTIKLDDIKIFRTHVKIGTGHSDQIKRLKTGPTYDTFTKILLDSKRDCLSTANRNSLKSTHGVNQRCYSLLSENTFLTFNDVKYLTDFDIHINEIHEEFHKVANNLLDQIYGLKSEDEKKAETGQPPIEKIRHHFGLKKFPTPKISMTRYYSALLKSKLKLRITNTMPVFDSNVTIHLVEFKEGAIEVNQATIDDLVANVQMMDHQQTERRGIHLLESVFSELYVERIPEDSVKEVTENNSFSKQMKTSLDVNLTSLEMFKKNCRVLRSWTKKLPSQSMWEFNLTEVFHNGIYLNKVFEHESVQKSTSNESLKDSTPMSTFLIIETYGDPRASVKRNKDGEVFTGVYSPSKHQYEVQFEIQHLAKPKTPDSILMFQKTSKNTEFVERGNSLVYYPEREEKFNVNFEDISLNNSKKLGYSLDISSNLQESQNINRLDEIINRLGKFYNSDTDEELTNDDLPFIQTGDEDADEDEENLDTTKSPYDENTHH
jgi:hypothetical protein